MLEMAEIADGERPALRAMADAYWQEIMPHSPVVQDPARRARYFETRFAAPPSGGHQWWAKVDGTVVGFANVQLLTDEAGDLYGYLKDFYILLAWRRRRHGEALAQLVFRWMKDRGARHISLHTRLDSPAATASHRH